MLKKQNLPSDDASEKSPFVIQLRGVFQVREYLRSRLIDYPRMSDPDKYEELERKGRLLTNGYRA